MEEKNKTSVQVSKETHKELMLFKIKSNVKNLDNVIKEMIKKLKETEKNESKNIRNQTA